MCVEEKEGLMRGAISEGAKELCPLKEPGGAWPQAISADQTIVTTIAIDVMSGDNPPREYVTGSLHALGHDAEMRALLVGQTDQIEPHLAGLTDSVRERIEIVPAATVVAMGDTPRAAIRRKKDSSMR